MAALTALAAQMTLPLWPVPFTLQTFAVLASGLLLGTRRGAAAQAAYLLAGAAGLPVFAGGRGGPMVPFGPTGGYLIAFVLAAWLAGAAAERWRGGRLLLTLSGTSLLVLGVGALWLSRFVGSSAWTAGFLLFVPSEILKAIIVWASLRGGPFRKEDVEVL